MGAGQIESVARHGQMSPGSGKQLTADCPEDTLAERLRRRPAKPMGSPRVGSNATGVDLKWEVRVAARCRVES